MHQHDADKSLKEPLNGLVTKVHDWTGTLIGFELKIGDPTLSREVVSVRA